MIWWSLHPLIESVQNLCSCFGAMADGSATTRPVGRWTDVLHAFAVSQSLGVRFEVVLVASPGVVNRATSSDGQGV